MRKSVLIIFIVFLGVDGFTQSLKGNRILAWQIDLAENNNYDSAFVYGYDACMESVHLFSTWSNIESDTGVFNAFQINGFLDPMDVYYPSWGMNVELQIAPTNTGAKQIPSELMQLPFNHSIVINRFKILLDTVFAHIPNVTLSALNIGNESDINFGTDINQYQEFKVFLDSVSNYAKALYFDLHGTDLKVGTTFTHHGLVSNATANLCKMVNDDLDIVAATYYPLNTDFTMKPTSIVSSDFAALVAEYPDTTQPIYFTECGYASSLLCNSSETLQADFWEEVFNSWDAYMENIKYVTVFKSTDWSTETVNELALFYGIQDTIFKEYLRTLGVRTWDGSGTNKEAYDKIKCELETRNWCDVSCSISNITKYINDESISFYPNPSKNAVTFSFDQHTNKPITFNLYNSQGQLVRSISDIYNSFEFKKRDLKGGIYFFHLVADNKVCRSGKLFFE
jgi:hypothetical protein